MKRIKAQLSEEQLDQFRAEASSFLQGGIGAAAYHELVVSLGLGSLVPEMAALLPDPDRRAELLSVHSAAQQAEQDLAADAAAAHAMQFGSWQCSRCCPSPCRGQPLIDLWQVCMPSKDAYIQKHF